MEVLQEDTPPFDEWVNGKGEPRNCFLSSKSSIAHAHTSRIYIYSIYIYTYIFLL